MRQDLANNADEAGGRGHVSDRATDGEPDPSTGTGVAVRQGSPSGVVATPWTGDDWALVVGTGSDLAELYDQIARLPAGLEFVEAFGDVDLVLVYRPTGQAQSRWELLGALVDQVAEQGGMLVGPVGPGGLSAGGHFQTSAERTAFAAGQADALAAMRRALTGIADSRPAAHGVPVAP